MKNILIAVGTALMLFGCSDNKKILHVYTWADYIDPTVIQEFEEKCECHVCIDTFDSNESMYAKLKAGASGYDICIPSSYMVHQMTEEGMLDKLDHTLLHNVITNFDHSFDAQIIDPNLTYSVPYSVTYGGLMYLKNKISETNMSWDVISNEKYFHRVSLLDDIREVIGIGLMYNGFSINSTNEYEIHIATETINKWKKNICKFDAESYKTEVASGSLYIGHGYSTDALQVIIGDGESEPRCDIGFVLPKEGFSIAFDEFVILKTSKNKDLAYKFIDFIYTPEASKKNIEYNFSAVPNRQAIAELDEELRKTVILDSETAKRGQVLKAFESPCVMEMHLKAWDEIKSLR